MPDAAKILDRVRSHGANVMLDGSHLEIINPRKLPEGAAAYIRQNAKAIAAFLDRESEFEERASIMEFDGGLTRSSAEYITKILLASPPDGANLADWQWFVMQSAKIAEEGLAA